MSLPKQVVYILLYLFYRHPRKNESSLSVCLSGERKFVTGTEKV